MELKWSDLFAYGNIVHPIVRRPGLRTPRHLSDFGFEEDASIEKSGTEGYWKLVPQGALKKIDRIGREVRDTVDSYSVPFPLVPGGMFVPDASINELLSKLTTLKEEYLTEVDILIRNYKKLLKEQCPAIRNYIKRINRKGDAKVAVRRVLRCAPLKSQLKSRFDVSWKVFAVQAPMNKDVAEIVEKEEESVRDAITKLVEETHRPIIEEIDRLTRLITKKRKTFLPMKSIDLGLRACDRFETKNIFKDKFVERSINRLRRLLKEMEAERKDGINEETLRALENLRWEIENSNTQRRVNVVVRKLSVAKKLGNRNITL